MSQDDKRLVAAFFLPATEDVPLPDLLARIGATDIGRIRLAPSTLVSCRWAGFSVEAFLDSRLGLRLLGLPFFQSAFFERLPDEELLTAFGDACEILRPLVALTATHLHQADVDALWALAPAVLEQDLARLVEARYGLVYVPEDMVDEVPYDADRDRVPIDSGVLIFGGSGEHRWS
jgi:hypothetical protein